MKETEIQGSIIDYLSYRRNLIFQRTNNIPVPKGSKNGKLIFRSLPKGSKKGWPDITLCYRGRFVGLEVKRPNGSQSIDQKNVEKEIKASGGHYFLVTSVEETIKVFEELDKIEN